MTRSVEIVGFPYGFCKFSDKTVVRSLVADNGIILCRLSGVASSKLVLALAIATAFCFAQRVKAEPRVQAGPSHINGVVPVPDAGSTLPLLGSALVALAALRRKLNR